MIEKVGIGMGMRLAHCSEYDPWNFIIILGVCRFFIDTFGILTCLHAYMYYQLQYSIPMAYVSLHDLFYLDGYQSGSNNVAIL